MTLKNEYKSWKDVPIDEFKTRWPNFSPQEIACRGTGKILMNFDALDRLQALRIRLGKPLVLNSAYRSPEHNKRVGGATNSLHMKGVAFDVGMANHNPAVFAAAAKAVGFRGFGHYPGSNFMHIDTGTARVWKGTGANNKWFFDPNTKVSEVATATPGYNPATPMTLFDKIKEVGPVAAPAILGPAVAMADGSGPVQWAIGALILIAAAVGIYWFVKHNRGIAA